MNDDGGIQFYQTAGQQQEYEYHKAHCGSAIYAATRTETEKETIMPKISEMLPSSYLKQSDFDENGFIVTIKLIEHKNIARDDEPDELKWIVYFEEYEKGMVLNSTNIQALGKACNSDDTDDWMGKEVVVFVDPNVGYAGKTTGGLRIKRHTAPAAPRQAAARASDGPPASFDTEIPF